MKKLCALLLSVIMAASLAVPAFADGPDGPPKPEDLGIIGGQDGPTAIITSGYDLEGLGLDTTDWVELEKQLQERQQQLIDQQKEALGGVPGQIGVMVNGEYIKFPDAAPEVTNGRTMVPVRALVEALGGEVNYTDDVVLLVIDEWGYEFKIGSTIVKARAYDTGIDTPLKTIEMDCAPYIKGGRTYVPIRFISEALGYEVGWDSGFQTAVLLDREALAAEFDKDFTIMNKVQANRVSGWEKGDSLSTDVKGNVSVTAFDTLSGSKTYKMDFNSQVLMNREAASGSFSIKLSDNIAALLVGQYADLDEEVLERMNLLVKALEDAEFIMNWDGQMWVKSPVLDELGGAKDIWCGMEMDEAETKAVFVGSDNATMGSALAAMASTDSVMMWSQAGVVVAAMELYRDENFTTSGGVSTLTLGLENLAGVYEALGGGSTSLDEVKALFKEYEITVKVDSKGGATVTCTMETAAQSGMPGMKLTIDCTQSSDKADLTMTFHVANVGEGKVTLTTAQQTTSEKPVSEPPAGANVVDAPELLGE